MIDTQKLRQRILDLAIRGKLVPQDPNDEPASVLLERIRAEKERLISEGKIKRPKKSKSSSSESHYQNFTQPFDIPGSWEWVRLPDISLIPITDGTHKTPTYCSKEEGIPFLSSKDVTSQKINWDNIRYITKELHKELYNRLAPQRNDILLAKNGTTGVAALVETDDIFDIYVTLALIRPIPQYVNPHFLLYVINSSFCKKQFNSHLTGIGLPNLHLTDIQKTLIPLPPYEEQERIVKKLCELLCYIDNLEQEKVSVDSLVSIMKARILELAMQGKLVPQDPTDEPAAEILKRINPKAKIITDNPHYPKLSYPASWCLVSIEDINSYKSETINPSNTPDKTFEVYSVSTFSTGHPEYLTGKEIGSTKQSVMKVDILLCKINPHLNRVWIVSQYSEYPQIASSEWIVIRSETIYAPFLKYYLESPEFRELLCSQVSGVGGSLTRAQPAIVKKYYVPVPPIKEQRAIVDKIKSLFSSLDEIKVGLEN